MSTELKEVFKGWVDIAPPVIVGKVPEGIRRVIPITGGRFEGPNLVAKVLPIGADWNIVRPDGMGFLSARYMIETDDGVVVSVLNEGWFRANDSEVQKLVEGESANRDTWYAKLHPRFEAPEGKYEWLNRSTFVCELHAPEGPDLVSMTFYELV
jgi:hypothetical protein